MTSPAAAKSSMSTLVMILPADLFPRRVVASVAGLVGFGGAMGGVVFNRLRRGVRAGRDIPRGGVLPDPVDRADRGSSGSKRRAKLLRRDSRLPEDALQSAGGNAGVIRNSDASRTLLKTNMGTGLSGYFEAQSLECPCRFAAGDVAGELHASINTGSVTKWRRIRRGASPGSKWQRTASCT